MAYSKFNEITFAIEATEPGTWDYNPQTDTLIANPGVKSWFGVRPSRHVIFRK